MEYILRNKKLILFLIFIISFTVWYIHKPSLRADGVSPNYHSSEEATCCYCNGTGNAKNAMGTCLPCGGSGSLKKTSTYYRSNCE